MPIAVSLIDFNTASIIEPEDAMLKDNSWNLIILLDLESVGCFRPSKTIKGTVVLQDDALNT